MQDELEPIWHSTEHDESDDIEASKLAEGEMTEFEKSEVYRKLEKEEGLMTGDINSEEDVALIKKRSVWGGSEADYTEKYWRRVVTKENILAGPDRPKKPWHFWKNEKWEKK